MCVKEKCYIFLTTANVIEFCFSLLKKQQLNVVPLHLKEFLIALVAMQRSEGEAVIKLPHVYSALFLSLQEEVEAN